MRKFDRSILLMCVIALAAGVVPLLLRKMSTPVKPPPSPLTIRLRRVLATTTEVRVRTGGLCHRDPMGERQLFTLQGSDATELVNSIYFVTDGQLARCLCCGGPTFEFYRDNKLLLSLSYQHGQYFSCTSGPLKGDHLIAPYTRWHVKNLLKPYGKF